MARGVNKVILLGNLGQDPEMKYLPSGGAVVNLRLATNDAYKDREGKLIERTEWHSVVMFNKLAEIAGQYLKKGRTVYIEGTLRTRKWQDKSGQDRYSTEIVANEMQMVGGAGGGGGGSAPMDDDGGYSAPSRGSSAPARGAPAQQSAPPAMDAPFEDDDIPF